jgi:DNA repair protein RecO (recombination protein O)
MSHILRTDAVVLRTMRYGETSLIVTLFTREQGKVAVLARGARTLKSRFGATVQPLSLVQAMISMRPTRTLQTLREAAHATRFRTLTSDLAKITAGLRMVELVRALTQDEEPGRALFDLLAASLSGLDALDAALGEQPAAALLSFEVRLARLLGFEPGFTREAVAALPDDGGVLHLATGQIGALTDVAGRRASRAALRAFAVAARADLDTALRMRLPDEALDEAVRLAEAYLQFHTEDAFPTRSNAVRAALGG